MLINWQYSDDDNEDDDTDYDVDPARGARRDEENGKNYYFVSQDEMMADIAANEYLEYGEMSSLQWNRSLEDQRWLNIVLAFG